MRIRAHKEINEIMDANCVNKTINQYRLLEIKMVIFNGSFEGTLRNVVATDWRYSGPLKEFRYFVVVI